MISVRIIKPYMLWQYPAIELWLADLAKEGWRLERRNGFAFHFRKSKPRNVCFRFLYPIPRAGNLLDVETQMLRCHAEQISSGLFDPVLLRMKSDIEGLHKAMHIRRKEHMRHFGINTLVNVMFIILVVMCFLMTEVVSAGEHVVLLLLLLACTLCLFQYLPAFILEWRSKP